MFSGVVRAYVDMDETGDLPGNWVQTDELNYKHPSGVELDIGETDGGWYRIDEVTDLRDPIGDGETIQSAKRVAYEYMESNP